jgi:hypothetical protein
MTDFLSLLKDDAYAASFQSLGQYRTALIAAYRDSHRPNVTAFQPIDYDMLGNPIYSPLHPSQCVEVTDPNEIASVRAALAEALAAKGLS